MRWFLNRMRQTALKDEASLQVNRISLIDLQLLPATRTSYQLYYALDLKPRISAARLLRPT
jgi:hypothetical protein